MLCGKIRRLEKERQNVASLKTLGLILAALFAFLSFSNVAAQQHSKIIEAIDFQGNRIYTDKNLLERIVSCPGELFDEQRMQNDLQSLLKLGLFERTRTKVLVESRMHGGVNVIFEIMELQVIAKFDFNSLRYVTKKDLFAELREQKVMLEVGTPYDPVKLQNVRRIIAEYLGKRGYADAKIDILEESKSGTASIITFVINELPDVEEDDCCEDDHESNPQPQLSPI